MTKQKFKTFNAFVENYSRRYPAPTIPTYWKLWLGADLIIHLLPTLAALSLSGWGTIKVITEARSMPAWAAITAVFVFEASLAVAAKSLGLGENWAMKGILWLILGLTGAVTMLTNSLDAMSSLGVPFDPIVFGWIQVIALGMIVPVLGILHIPPLSAKFRTVAERVNDARTTYNTEHKEWLEGVWATYERRMAHEEGYTSPEVQRTSKQSRQVAVYAALDSYLDEAYSGDLNSFSLPQSFVAEQADFYGVRDFVIQRDVRDWRHDQTQKANF